MKVEIIRRPNRLKAKVSGSELGGVGTIASEVVDRAPQIVAEYSERYPEQAEIDISRLAAAASAVMLSPEGCGERIERLRREAREIMGQGETFGYLLLTRFARSLYDFCGGIETLTEQQAQVVQAHVEAMTLVVLAKVTGDGGAVGRELLRSLAVAQAKFAASAS